jgi:hypothetical protein
MNGFNQIKITTQNGGRIMNNDIFEGLLIKGSVAGRSKQIVGDKNLELVTYKIFAGNKVFFVKDWAPKKYLTVGEAVELPISVKPFQRNGHISVDYTICDSSVSGVEF